MISTAGRLAPADVRDELTAPTSPVKAREQMPAREAEMSTAVTGTNQPTQKETS
jgi:hypothetical protein